MIRRDPENHTAFAVRAAWLEPGMAPYLGSMDYMRARNRDEFLAAMDRWGAPSENQVYADTTGTIGWKTGGLTPIRPTWDGALPVSGDGRFEWARFYDADQLPAAVDDPHGYFATANEMNLPPDHPDERTITHDWYSLHRKQRIDELLGARRDFGVDDMPVRQAKRLARPPCVAPRSGGSSLRTSASAHWPPSCPPTTRSS